MPLAIIKENRINFPLTDADFLNRFRLILIDCGFNIIDSYSDASNYYWIADQNFDPSAAKGRIYVRFRINKINTSVWFLYIATYLTWNSSTRTGTGASTEVSPNYISGQSFFIDPTATHFFITVTCINHPEIKGYIINQADRVAYGLILFPSELYNGYGWKTLFPGAFLANPFDFANCFQATGKDNNPFDSTTGQFNINIINYYKFLKANGNAQLYEKLKINAPDDTGFIAAFQDLALAPSNNLKMPDYFTQGTDKYLVIKNRSPGSLVIPI